MATENSGWQERSFTDSHGVEIFTYTATPKKPRAVMVLVHGLGEHAKRYQQLVSALNKAGVKVYLIDNRGHGATGMAQHGGDTSQLGRLGKGGLRAAIAAVEQHIDLAQRENPGLPLFLFGHSWGSLMNQQILNRRIGEFAGAILSGTAYSMPGHINSGNLNKRHANLGTTGYEWLSRDAAVAERFAADPLCFAANVPKLFGLLDGARLFVRPARNLPQVPLLIQVGGDDSLGGGRSAQKLGQEYRDRSGLTDVTVTVYEGARHEIYNETNRDEVTAELIDWITQRLPETAD